MTNSALEAASPPPKSPFKSTTFWGAALTAGAMVVGDWKNPVTWFQSIGIVTAAYGARKAISKNGMGV